MKDLRWVGSAQIKNTGGCCTIDIGTQICTHTHTLKMADTSFNLRKSAQTKECPS